MDADVAADDARADGDVQLVYLALLVVVGFVVGCKKEDASTAAENAAKEAGATTNAPAK